MPNASESRVDAEPPANAYVRNPRSLTPSDALELQELQTREDNEQWNYSSASASSGEEYRVTTRTVSRSSVRPPRPERKGVWKNVCRFWTRNIAVTVPQKSNRDHLALERTFLAYIRTSVVIAMQGVLISQLFRLQRPTSRENYLNFYDLGIPLAVTCHCVAAVVALIGAYRFWRQQNAISRGKVHAGGWELNSVGILLGLLILVTLVLSVVVLIEIDLHPLRLIQQMFWR